MFATQIVFLVKGRVTGRDSIPEFSRRVKAIEREEGRSATTIFVDTEMSMDALLNTVKLILPKLQTKKVES